MKYADIVFMQGDAADEAFVAAGYDGHDSSTIDPRDLLRYLSQWDFGSESESEARDSLSHGGSDHVFESGDYILSWSYAYGYCGLQRRVEDQ